MKLLSIAIPCYNSEKYMRKCIDSLLVGGEDVEILIVDDGSTKDRTAEIADEYEAQFPTIVRAIHKENGGHGSAVNTGIANATGLYFKVVDSDDWVKQDAYFKILDTLRELAGGGQALDMLISNYVYEKEGERRKKVIQYRHILPVEKMFTWADCHHFIKGHYILMHSVIFRTKLLQECGLKLPEHIIILTFQVNLRQHRTIPALRLKHRSGGCGTASAAPRSPYRHLELCGIALTNCPNHSTLHQNVQVYLCSSTVPKSAAFRAGKRRWYLGLLQGFDRCVQAAQGLLLAHHGG